MTVQHESVLTNTLNRCHMLNRGVVLAALAALAVMASACGGCESQRRNPSASHIADSPRIAGSAAEDNAPAAAARAAGSALEQYAFGQPHLRATLPPRLREVSGLTDISETEVACVQDEDGVVFVYDLGQQKVTRQVRFGPSGDYEGLTRVGKRLYVLRSDGMMYEVDNWLGDPRVRTRDLKLPTSNNEGLGFDPNGNQLLIAPKSRSEDPVTPRQKRQHKEQVRERTERETEQRLADVLDQQQLELFRQIRKEEDLKPGG